MHKTLTVNGGMGPPYHAERFAPHDDGHAPSGRRVVPHGNAAVHTQGSIAFTPFDHLGRTGGRGWDDREFDRNLRESARSDFIERRG